MFDGEKIKSEISRVVLEQKQRKLVIAGTPKLSVWPDVGISLQGVTLSERASDEAFLSLDAARVSVAVMPLLSRQVQVRALEVDGLKATLIKHKDGSLNIADLMGQDAPRAESKPADGAKAASAPLQINVKSIRLSNAQLSWRDDQAGTRTDVSNLSLSTGSVQADSANQSASVDKLLLTIAGKAGSDAFELKLDAPKLNLSPKQSSSDALTLSATLNGAARNASVNLSLSGVQGNAEQLRIASLAVKLDAKAGDNSVKGQLSSPVTVNVANQAVSLSKLVGSLDIANPAMPMKQVALPIQGALQFNGKAQSAALDLSTQFDESKIVSHIQLDKFSPLAMAFDLDIDKLNLDKYLPPKPAESANTQASSAAAKDAPVDLSVLKSLTANGAMRIGALQASNIKLDKINAKINLASGKLDIAPLSLNLYQGSANGSISANANGNAVAVKQTLTGISINPLMKDLLHKDLLEGHGAVTLDINTHGATVGAMKKALGGSASLSLKDGAVKGINLAQTLRDAKAKLGQADSTQAANASQKTDFSELAASFKIANGVAHNDDLTMKSPYIRLGGAGDIDVGGGQMNYLAKASVVNSDVGQGGADLGQLKGLSVPVRVSGPFDALGFKIEWAAMLEDATKAMGDIALPPMDIMAGLESITLAYTELASAGVRPLSVGGDHLVTLPVFRGIARNRALGMVHFDAHSDTNDSYFGGQRYTHGTPFRRAVEEGLLDPKRTVQIGIRGSVYDASDLAFALDNGIRVIHMEEFATRPMDDVLAEVRSIVGDAPTYISFDVDCLDPCFAPGTGTPEIGGMSTLQAQYMVRGLQGLNLVGADVVEVSPPFDVAGATALVGATLAFELLCLLADAHATRGRLSAIHPV